MNRLFLLGYSEAVLSLILETIWTNRSHEEVIIVRNMELPEELPFRPTGLKVEVINAHNWQCSSADQLFFGVATPAVKQKIFHYFVQSHGIAREQFTNIFHPTCTIASTATLQKGIYIEPQAVVSPFARIGFGTVINRGVTIGHHTELQDYCSINPGVHIAGNCSLGTASQVGIGAVLFNKVRIGSNTVIGGGSVVTSNIPDGVIAWGNPCKVIRNTQ